MNPPSLPALPRGGILNISKPSGLTSFQVVRQVRRILGEKRVGHCGTLDPMASGVLVVVFGSATVLQDQFMAGEKVYRAEMKLGIKTDTGDITGKPLMTCEPPKISTLQIQKAFEKFTGEISQVPPMYSALKRDGKPLYAYARAGVEVHRDPRPVTIHALTLIALRHPVIEFRVVCSKGADDTDLGRGPGGTGQRPRAAQSHLVAGAQRHHGGQHRFGVALGRHVKR
jgi:tRNA pseudouridine55 synthase